MTTSSTATQQDARAAASESAPAFSIKRLHQLAKAYGIDTDYVDAFGNEVTPPAETLIKILGIMGVHIENDEQIEQAIRNKQQHDATQTLAPTYVVSLHHELTGDEIGIPVNLNTNLTGHSASWQLTLEDGSQHQGDWTPEPPENIFETSNNGTYGKYWCRFNTPLPYGYHTLSIQVGDIQASQHLIITPHYCYQPPAGTQHWGAAIQLYAQRSEQNLGIGNYQDLTDVVSWAAQQRAGMVGVNPLHSLFPSRAGHRSPYSPASRHFINHLYIAPQITAEFADCPDAANILLDNKEALTHCRQSDLVDYETLSPIMLSVLKALFSTFKQQHLTADLSVKLTERGQHYQQFKAHHGKDLEQFATFLAISEVIDKQNARTTCWWDWPAGLQDANSTDVERFKANHAELVELYQYIQFIAAEQLNAAATHAKTQGMAVGLYGDLAVGSDVSGADVWANPSLYATTVRVGCPPDDCNRLGQDWGLPAIKPNELLKQGLKPWARLLQANMAHFGALRIDHAMAMLRLFWIPEGMNGTQGTYVRYPYYQMLGVLALESHRNQCVVIGEDLGTVPPVIGETFPQWGVHSYKLLYFEQNEQGGYLAPDEFPPMAMATLTTHDLATLPGFWQADDINARDNLGLYPTEEVHHGIRNARPVEKQALMDALHQHGLWGSNEVPHEWSVDLTKAVYQYLRSTPCQLMMCQLEDFVGQVEQVNLPGTVNEYPNWQRKLPMAVNKLKHLTVSFN